MKPQDSKAAAIVIGANGAIGGAALERIVQEHSIDTVFDISRKARPTHDTSHKKIVWLESDSSEASISKICQHIQRKAHTVTHIVIATGKLHDREQSISPEKRIDSLNSQALRDIFNVNTFVPMLWLSGLSDLLQRGQRTAICVLSARVGSIEDNRLGGWYSYRASKAALTMMLKTLSIEFKKRFPLVKIIAFHPGTTDSKLSKPFHANVAPQKLFTPAFVAEQLWEQMNHAQPDGSLSFRDWQHKDIPW